MKICLISMEYPPEEGWGGIGKYTYNLAHGLEKIGQNVTVISSSAKQNIHYLDGKIEVYRIKRRNKFGSTLFPMDAFTATLSLIRKRGVDIVEAPLTFGEGSGFILIRDRPIVISLHTPSFVMAQLYGLPSLVSIRWQMLEKTVLQKCDKILSNTAANGALITERYRIDPSKIRLVPHGINIDRYLYSDHGLRRRLGLAAKKAVLFVGRLEKRKGVDILLNAIPEVTKQIPDVGFVFVGQDTNSSPEGGSYKQYITEKSLANGTRQYIHLVGRASDEELVEYYYSCDVFVAPSRYESFGLVYLEAMACSKPVVGTNIGGIPEVIDDGKTGLLFPLGDSRSLANVLIELLSDGNKRAALGANARKSVEENFTDIAMASRTLKVFDEAIAQYSP